MGRLFFPLNFRSVANNTNISNPLTWLHAQMEGSGLSSWYGITFKDANGISLINHLAQNWPAWSAICSFWMRLISPSLSKAKGGKSAMGKARHMEAIKDIMPNLVKAALIFPMGDDVMEDGKENSVDLHGEEGDGTVEKRALSTILVLLTSSVKNRGVGFCVVLVFDSGPGL